MQVTKSTLAGLAAFLLAAAPVVPQSPDGESASGAPVSLDHGLTVEAAYSVVIPVVLSESRVMNVDSPTDTVVAAQAGVADPSTALHATIAPLATDGHTVQLDASGPSFDADRTIDAHGESPPGQFALAFEAPSGVTVGFALTSRSNANVVAAFGPLQSARGPVGSVTTLGLGPRAEASLFAETALAPSSCLRCMISPGAYDLVIVSEGGPATISVRFEDTDTSPVIPVESAQQYLRWAPITSEQSRDTRELVGPATVGGHLLLGCVGCTLDPGLLVYQAAIDSTPSSASITSHGSAVTCVGDDPTGDDTTCPRTTFGSEGGFRYVGGRMVSITPGGGWIGGATTLHSVGTSRMSIDQALLFVPLPEASGELGASHAYVRSTSASMASNATGSRDGFIGGLAD